MKKFINLLIVIFIGVLLLFPVMGASATENIEINFFYSQTCPHCTAEQKFLDELENKYPEVKINRYLASEAKNEELLLNLCKKCEAERYIGLVPLTFVGDDFFVGFDNAEGIGQQIEDSLQRQIQNLDKTSDHKNIVNLPIIGQIDLSKYSLPVLSVVLGALDGFNVCSLGALVLILGLTLALKSRRKILIFGGIFVFTTAIVYGLLIIFWHQLFSYLNQYLRTLEILIAVLAFAGGIYFIKEFIRFRKQGPTCEIGPAQKIASKFSTKLQNSLAKSKNIFIILGSVLAFAAIITIVEFPCSAAIPVIYAGILANSHLSTFAYLFYIALFVIFYMLDEIIVFLIAVLTMKLWLASAKIFIWITLIEAIILFILGFYYLI